VRVIDENGEMIGIMTPMQALAMARERNLDLVEISPQATPPVCKLMDYGRFKYESAKRENEARKRQKLSEVKEIRLHAHTDSHDITVRVKKILEFLADGDKVKVSVQFRGREVFHPEIGRQMLESIVTQLKGAAQVERSPMLEGRNLWMMLTRTPGWDPKKAADAEASAAVKSAANAAASTATAPTEPATPPPASVEPAPPSPAPAEPTTDTETDASAQT
jgi:translation initiation factor IF-3